MNLAKIQQAASEYGYIVSEEGNISTASGKTTSVQIIEKRNKIIAQGADGNKLATLKDENAIGWFLESYWYAKKKA